MDELDKMLLQERKYVRRTKLLALLVDALVLFVLIAPVITLIIIALWQIL